MMFHDLILFADKKGETPCNDANYSTFFLRIHYFPYMLLRSLIANAQALLDGAILSVTDMGRHLAGEAKVKHKIKRTDRLLSNTKLYSQKTLFYKTTTQLLFRQTKELIILIDWSAFKHKRDIGVMRASAPFHGRAITIYQETVDYKKLAKFSYQKQFLAQLKQILPENCCPIIVTDMGYYSRWFHYVRSLGWHFVGRVRELTTYQENNEPRKKLTCLTPTNKPQKKENIILFKTNRLQAHLITWKKRTKEKRNYVSNPMIKQYQRQTYQPWFLVTSVNYNAKTICEIYKQRMWIETSFRDVKSHRYGFGLNLSFQYSQSLVRREILLLVSHIAHIMLLIVGWIVSSKGMHRSFQANSLKNKRVLSLSFVGKCVFTQNNSSLNINELCRHLSFLLQQKQCLYEQLAFCGDP